MAVDIALFTDPACPFAFSAEPNRQRLRWYYGDQLRWRLNMIVLTLEPGEDAKLAEGAPGLQRKYGMPIDPNPYARTFSSEPACRAVVAARLNAPGAEAPLLRRLRVRAMLGGLLDDPALLARAAADVGLDPDEVDRWSRCPRWRTRCARTSRPPAPPVPPPAGSTTSSGVRRTSGATPRRATSSLRGPHVLDPRLQPDRGLRDRPGQLRPQPPLRARVRRAGPGLGERAARDRRDHRDHAGRPRQDPRRAGPRRHADPGGRGLLLDASVR